MLHNQILTYIFDQKLTKSCLENAEITFSWNAVNHNYGWPCLLWIYTWYILVVISSSLNPKPKNHNLSALLSITKSIPWNVWNISFWPLKSPSYMSPDWWFLGFLTTWLVKNVSPNQHNSHCIRFVVPDTICGRHFQT